MNEPMRVALLNDSFPPVIDGVANVVSNYAGILHRAGQQVVVAAPDHPAARDNFPYAVVRYPSLGTEPLVGYRAGYPFSARAVRRLEAFAPDILHVHCPMSSLLLARTLRESTRAPLILTYHTKYDVDICTAVKSERVQQKLIYALVQNISACDEVWTVSRGAGENLCSLGYTGAWRVMENGVDMPCGPAPLDDVRAVSDLYGLRDDVPVLLFVGRLRWYKGVRLILEGLGKARARGLDFQLLLVGEGADRADMEALARELHLADCCIFAGAVHDRAMLRACYTRADLFLFPSTYDTNGLVVREAAAAGLPALLVRGSCAAEGVTDGVNGLLMEETADDLCEKVLAVCGRRDKLCELGEGAQRDLYISWDMAVARAQRRYAEILQEQQPLRRDTLGAWTAEVIELHNHLRALRKK